MNSSIPRGRNISQGASILARHVRSAHSLHDDVDEWGAPTECHGLVVRLNAREFRLVRRRIKAVTGLKFNAFVREVERRTSPRWVHFNLPW